ncbi:MAG: GGDEF domain-containing protein [Polyangiales bacterium]
MAGDDEFSDERTVVGERVQIVSAPTGRGPEQAYVIVIAGPNVGEMFKVGDGGDIGRGTDAAFRLTDTEISRHHARFVVRDGNVLVQDLNSTNGTFVNGAQVKLQPLKDGDKIQVGTTTILKFSYHDDLEEQFQRRMYESALRDGLTKAFNKKYFHERLESEVAYALRHDSALSLILLDLDHFKRINDTYGHLAGDYVLSTFSSSVLSTIRKEDVFARYGGEEFALISRGLDSKAAHQFAERVRSAVERFAFTFQGQRMPVTVSVGISAMPESQALTAEALVDAADKALYAAKSGGRNRVCVHTP